MGIGATQSVPHHSLLGSFLIHLQLAPGVCHSLGGQHCVSLLGELASGC